MFLVRLLVYVMGNICFVGGMEMEECRERQTEGGGTVCEGKQILKFNKIARKQVKNGRAFKGYVVI
jgi:hypothetical protein